MPHTDLYCVLRHRQPPPQELNITPLNPGLRRLVTGGSRLAAILVSGLQVLVSRPTVSLGEIAGKRFRSRLMFFSEHLMHKA
jgi:hypothetical protein